MSEEKAHFVKLNRGLIMPEDLDDDGFDDYADDDSKQYLYMELESTSNYKDFDIDKMLESASLEQFTK